jgi:hypothetical protein
MSFLILLAAFSFVSRADQVVPTGASSPQEGGENVQSRLPPRPPGSVSVKAGVGDAGPSHSSGELGPDQQSQVGAGVQFRFGTHSTPNPDPDAGTESNGD